MPIVDNPDATALTFARYSPADFSDTASTTNNNPGIRPLKQERLQACIFIICQVFSDESSEDRCFYEDHVGLYYTAMPYSRSKFGIGDPCRGWVRAAYEPGEGKTTGRDGFSLQGGIGDTESERRGDAANGEGQDNRGGDGLSQPGG
jgi:hypothetical protein